jgi:hypothetical protein
MKYNTLHLLFSSLPNYDTLTYKYFRHNLKDCNQLLVSLYLHFLSKRLKVPRSCAERVLHTTRGIETTAQVQRLLKRPMKKTYKQKLSIPSNWAL